MRSNRASRLFSAINVRIRINTIATNNNVKPNVVNGSGHKISGAIADPFSVIDGAWWSDFHQITEP